MLERGRAVSAIVFQPGETFPQARDRTIREDMAKFGISQDEADENLFMRHPEWLSGAADWLRAGVIPSQAWINSSRHEFPEWWDRRVCHDMPDAFDRMARAGRSLYCTKQVLNG